MYWIAHNNDDIVHYGWAEDMTQVYTGQPELESFADQDEFIERLAELGVNLTIEGEPTDDPRAQEWIVT